MMRVVLDTNALIQIFGRSTTLVPLREAFRHSSLE